MKKSTASIKTCVMLRNARRLPEEREKTKKKVRGKEKEGRKEIVRKRT